jgi:hypothetical protein
MQPADTFRIVELSSQQRAELQLLADYPFEGRNEADIRGDWIDPLLRLLGYGLGTRHRVLREQAMALRPPTRMIGSSRIEIDFVPTVFGQRLWIIEAKRPRRGELFSDEHLGQAWSYATDPRIAVSLMVLCDGTRIGVFDLTGPTWDIPVFDRPKDELPQHFGELVDWLGAPRVAERLRQVQLGHLRTALEAQVDLAALDRTVDEVKAMVDNVRPVIRERREEIRRETEERTQAAAATARDTAGIWGLAQHLNGPLFTTLADIDKGVELIRRQAPVVRVREFDDFEKATIPNGQQDPRMWFWLRIVRMGCAVLLVTDDRNGEHFEGVASQAARDHATSFAESPLDAAAHRLQLLLGPLGWRIAANSKPALDAQAKHLVESLEAEEWLRLDAHVGIKTEDAYKRIAILSPLAMLARVRPWDVETIERIADSIEELLQRLPKPAGLDHLQPAGDPWQESWLRNDPLPDASAATLQRLAQRSDAPAAAALAERLLLEHYTAA